MHRDDLIVLLPPKRTQNWHGPIVFGQDTEPFTGGVYRASGWIRVGNTVASWVYRLHRPTLGRNRR